MGVSQLSHSTGEIIYCYPTALHAFWPQLANSRTVCDSRVLSNGGGGGGGVGGKLPPQTPKLPPQNVVTDHGIQEILV